ncbi:MAG: alpha/beta hydrolase [Chloroflexi bacterium]|nr:alpha/beta hydrolase [Chloroflexota bacterium]
MLVERTFDTGTVSIHYVEEPSDGPPLLLLHGIVSRWQNFLNVLPALTPRFHVYAADLRGHGRSGRVPGRYGLMDYAEDVIALLRHLGNGPTVLIGQSLGSMISIGVASEAPELVRAVVLGDPPLGAFDGRPFGMRPEYARFSAQRALAREGHSVSVLSAKLMALQPAVDAVTTRARAHTLSQIDPEVLTPVIENTAVEHYDLADRLRRIGCPVLMLQGNPAHGGALEDREAQWAASLIPDCTHVTLPDVGHGIHTEAGPRYSYLVPTFLESL